VTFCINKTRIFFAANIMSSSSTQSMPQAQREIYRHKLMFELMFRDEEQVDLKRYIRAFVSR